LSHGEVQVLWNQRVAEGLQRVGHGYSFFEDVILRMAQSRPRNLNDVSNAASLIDIRFHRI